ncbi:dTDP-4-dehydrorhamnose reductase [Vibrio gazogenes]|uniref:dTDP-4-dehydrorhamnose reductase n=1 Tax=Vibrio gazogenes TaxID=687 RepID=A0A1Z2SFG6_VIBGA|nr:dTDP-4-dehydrorhamnose reductase [Vibrio gazogenes]ASA55895.1 dTDP-4-dehydrorhamnose reductase [Vibrio gazogenes]
MKVLITGCKGQVGHCLVEKLINKNATFLAVDKEQLDITDQVAVMKLIKEFSPDVIINAAAYTAVDKAESEADLAYKINRDGVKYLAQAATMVDAAILHISTDYVFEGNSNQPYTESDATNPTSIYGKSKLAGELAVQKECARHIIIRTAWVFGEHGNNFVKTMLKLGRQRNALGIVADQVGGPTYAGDIASVLINIAEQIVSKAPIEYGIYHFSGLPHVSWFDFANHIFDVALAQNLLVQKPVLSAITTEMYPTPARRPANSKLAITKIEHHFGIDASDWQNALNNLKPYCN